MFTRACYYFLKNIFYMVALILILLFFSKECITFIIILIFSMLLSAVIRNVKFLSCQSMYFVTADLQIIFLHAFSKCYDFILVKIINSKGTCSNVTSHISLQYYFTQQLILCERVIGLYIHRKSRKS